MMKKFFSCAVLGFTVVYLGCNINFTEPAHNPPEIDVDPSPYLGEWDLVNVAGEEVEAGRFHLSIVQISDATLTATYSGQTQPGESFIFKLTTIDNRTIVSVKHTKDTWRIFQAGLRENGDRLVLQALDYEKVKSDVLSGVLPGQVLGEPEGLLQCVDVSASGEEIRAYLQQRPTGFGSEFLFAPSAP